MLQWGRDQLIAEICSAGPAFGPAAVELQWGRDQLIAEIRWLRSLHNGTNSFNGAAIK